MVYYHRIVLLPGAVYDVVVHLVVGEGSVLVDSVHSTKTVNIVTIVLIYILCPRSSDQFYIGAYYIKWVTTSWTNSRIQPQMFTWQTLTSY